MLIGEVVFVVAMGLFISFVDRQQKSTFKDKKPGQ
jgi:hypothetical protein